MRELPSTKILARHTIKTIAAGADLLRHVPSGLTILIYHRVGRRTNVEVDLPGPLFNEQMSCLAEVRAATTMDSAVATLSERLGASRDVVVTFDDGTADFVDEALPILVKYEIPAILYVATEFIEEQRAFPDDGQPVSWSGLADALSTGLVIVGSHTHTHALLDRIDARVAGDELDRSIGLIEDRLGVTPNHFAYPKALLGSPAAEREVRARFESAAVAGTRTNVPGRADVYRLSRSPIQLSDGMRWWRHKVAGGMGLEDALRQRIGRIRYARSTT